MTSAWLNGQPADAAWAANRGLNYGDGVFRTLLFFDGRLVDRERQLTVLERDCRQLGLTLPPREEVDRALQPALDGAEAACVIKLIAIRRDAGRGYRPASDESILLVRRLPLPDYPARCWTQGIIAAQGALHMAAQPALAGAKHLNRLEQVLASRDWPPGVDEILLGDAVGHPASGSRSNLFWVSGGVLFTPRLGSCGVHGMMRDKICRCAQAAGVELQRVDAAWAALLAADEVFVCNSLVGIWPVRRLDERQWQAPGELTSQLWRAIDHPWRGVPVAR